jgi:hypothetical protein
MSDKSPLGGIGNAVGGGPVRIGVPSLEVVEALSAHAIKRATHTATPARPIITGVRLLVVDMLW